MIWAQSKCECAGICHELTLNVSVGSATMHGVHERMHERIAESDSHNRQDLLHGVILHGVS